MVQRRGQTISQAKEPCFCLDKPRRQSSSRQARRGRAEQFMKYRLWLRSIASDGRLSAWSAPGDFAINTPAVLSSLTANQTTHRPAISWSALPGAARYSIWINNLGTAGQNPARDPATPTSLLIDDVKIETSAAPGTGQLATSTFDRTPEFRWRPSQGAASSEIFIRNMSTGVTTVQKNISGNSWTPLNDLPDGPYRWWVDSSTAQGFRSNWSEPVDVQIGGRTNITGPIGTTSDRRPEFSWQPVDGAGTWQLWVSRIDAPAVVINLSGLISTSFTPTSPLAPGSYRVWVRAISSREETGVWSLPKNFTII